MNKSNSDELKITHDTIIYRPKVQAHFTISETDWRRLKKFIGGIIPAKQLYQIVSNAMFGVSCSVILNIISLVWQKDLASWVIITNISLFLLSTGFGFGFYYLDSQQKELIKYSKETILDEMRIIEENNWRPEN